MKVAAEKRIRAAVCQWLRARHEMIDPIPKQGLFNYRCHNNAVQWAKDHPGCSVVECIYIDDGYPILHYLNVDLDGRYLETTLGYRADGLEYYFIRKIHPDDYKRIEREFDNVLGYYLKRFTNWFHRRVLGIERVV